MAQPSAYIVDAVRTAGGRRNGRLAGWHPADMAAEVLDAVVARSRIDPAAVARAVAFAIEQPDDVDIGDITLRPTVQN